MDIIFYIIGNLILITIGIYIIKSAIKVTLEDGNENRKLSSSLVLIFDIFTDPISSNGIRLFFGSAMIIVGLLLLALII